MALRGDGCPHIVGAGSAAGFESQVSLNPDEQKAKSANGNGHTRVVCRCVQGEFESRRRA